MGRGEMSLVQHANKISAAVVFFESRATTIHWLYDNNSSFPAFVSPFFPFLWSVFPAHSSIISLINEEKEKNNMHTLANRDAHARSPYNRMHTTEWINWTADSLPRLARSAEVVKQPLHSKEWRTLYVISSRDAICTSRRMLVLTSDDKAGLTLDGKGLYFRPI